MQVTNARKERGIALLLSVLALLLLSAVAAGMIYMASTEKSIAGNFKTEETVYFAARAGIEEVRDRMIPASGIAPYGTAPYNISAMLPSLLPNATNQNVLYILQNNPQSPVSMSNITTSGNALYDDELCHDYVMTGMSKTSANVRCTTQPSGSWYSTPATVTSPSPYLSQAPNWNNGGVSNPVDWKWTRITVKASNSTPYCIDGTTGTTCANQTAAVACYDGTSERQVAPGGFATAVAACASISANPVYLLTSLAVSSTGTRRVVQAEIAQTPQNGNQPAGLFATGTGCNAASNPLSFGGTITTGSFLSANESPANSMPTLLSSGGNVGANGGISVGGTSATINGQIVSTLPPGTTGCPLSVTTSGNPTINGVPPEIQIPSPYVPLTPTIPANVPQTACNSSHACWTTSGNGNNAVNLLTPGTYGNISISSSTNLTLQSGTAGNPAVYNINSLSEAGQATISLSQPYGPVVINIAGGGVTSSTPVLDLSGGGFSNSSYVPSNMTINYGGTGAVKISGGAAAFFVLDAPQASLTLVGGGNSGGFYGSAVAKTITVQGNTAFYWDQSTIPPPTTNTNPFNVVAMRELSY